MNSIAAPVYGASGAVVGALACGGPSFRLTEESAIEYGPMIAAIGLALSKRLGYSGHLDTITAGAWAPE